MGTDAPRTVLALDWYLLVAQTQQPGEILSLVLAPRADATGSEEPINEERSPRPARSMFLHYTYQWSLEQGGTGEKGGVGSNAAEVPSVWGEIDRHGKYLKTEQHALPQGSHPWAGSMISEL